MPDSLLMSALLPDCPIRTLEETVSTNTDARAWLNDGAAHGSLVMADCQSGGRGRMGRAFCSPQGGLYMSLVMHTDAPAGALTTLCAVAVRQAVEALCGISADIKWVNDLQLSGKKVCGILCEGVYEGSERLGVVAGIGLNVAVKAFPPELSGIAASLYPQGDAPAPLERFAAEIARRILDQLPVIPAHMAEYRAHCVTLGKTVSWQDADGEHSGYAAAVADDGALLIETQRGTLRLAAGEVSLRAGD